MAVSLADPVLLFLDELEAGGRTPGTLLCYRTVFSAFERHLRGPIIHASPLDVRDFLDSQKSINTRALRLITLRQFFRFLHKRKLIAENPTDGIPIPQRRRRRWPIITEEEFQELLGTCRDPALRLLILILYRVGSRISETYTIRLDHITLGEGGGTIDFPKRKGGEVGFAAYGSDVAQALRERLMRGGVYLFPDTRNPPTPYRMAEAMLRLGRKVGIPGRLTPHRLRHSFITLAVDAGWSQLALQQQVGHKTPVSTAVYYHPSRKGLRETYQRYFPTTKLPIDKL